MPGLKPVLLREKTKSMEILKTKLYVPPLRPEWVSRPRLLERLKAGLQLKLTLVAAPAGYGKTTLLSEGVRSSQMSVNCVEPE